MNNLPKNLKDDFKTDPFYKSCCLENANCAYETGHRRIEWHHSVIFAGKQLQEKWAILPACSGFHHKFADRHDIKDAFLRIAVRRATEVELARVSKVIDYRKWLSPELHQVAKKKKAA